MQALSDLGVVLAITFVILTLLIACAVWASGE